MNILITTIVRNMGYFLLPLCIYLGITVYNYKGIINEQNDKIYNLSFELNVANTNVTTLRKSIEKQNKTILELQGIYNTKNDFYSNWLTASDMDKYGSKANTIFNTKDLDEKLKLIKSFDVNK